MPVNGKQQVIKYNVNDTNYISIKPIEKSKKKKINRADKTKLWNLFNNEINVSSSPLECIYNKYENEYVDGKPTICNKCGNYTKASETNFLTCSNKKCGIIYKDLIDHTAEWRYYNGENSSGNVDVSRCGMAINPLLQESSFGCKILYNCKKSSYEMSKIRKYTEWQAMPYKEKSQYDEFQIITVMAQNAGISKIIIDDAKKYHKKISDYNLNFRGNKRDGIIAASIYISCRINNCPRRAKEISDMFHLDVTSATIGCTNAISIIKDIEKDELNSNKTKFCQLNPESFIDRYCSKLNINSELTKLCKFISFKIKQQQIMLDNTPHSITSSILCFISHYCKLSITKKDIKIVTEISEVTINKCFKKLDSIRTLLLPQQIINKYNIVFD
jgi:transcription initiation factor TFIIB